MEKLSLKENGKNENICFKIHICNNSITHSVPQMMAAGTGMAGDVAAMAASASVHSQPMAPGDMQVRRSGFFVISIASVTITIIHIYAGWRTVTFLFCVNLISSITLIVAIIISVSL